MPSRPTFLSVILILCRLFARWLLSTFHPRSLFPPPPISANYTPWTSAWLHTPNQCLTKRPWSVPNYTTDQCRSTRLISVKLHHWSPISAKVYTRSVPNYTTDQCLTTHPWAVSNYTPHQCITPPLISVHIPYHCHTTTLISTPPWSVHNYTPDQCREL